MKALCDEAALALHVFKESGSAFTKVVITTES